MADQSLLPCLVSCEEGSVCLAKGERAQISIDHSASQLTPIVSPTHCTSALQSMEPSPNSFDGRVQPAKTLSNFLFTSTNGSVQTQMDRLNKS